MKIDTSSPRLPINRLKRPLKQQTSLPENENQVGEKDASSFSETFERLILDDGAKRFEQWLENLEIK